MTPAPSRVNIPPNQSTATSTIYRVVVIHRHIGCGVVRVLLPCRVCAADSYTIKPGTALLYTGEANKKVFEVLGFVSLTESLINSLTSGNRQKPE